MLNKLEFIGLLPIMGSGPLSYFDRKLRKQVSSSTKSKSEVMALLVGYSKPSVSIAMKKLRHSALSAGKIPRPSDIPTYEYGF